MVTAHFIKCPHCGAQRNTSGDYTSPANQERDLERWEEEHVSKACIDPEVDKSEFAWPPRELGETRRSSAEEELAQAFGARPGGEPSFRAELEGDDYLFGRRPMARAVDVAKVLGRLDALGGDLEKLEPADLRVLAQAAEEARVYQLESTLAQPEELGDTAARDAENTKPDENRCVGCGELIEQRIVGGRRTPWMHLTIRSGYEHHTYVRPMTAGELQWWRDQKARGH